MLWFLTRIGCVSFSDFGDGKERKGNESKLGDAEFVSVKKPNVNSYLESSGKEHSNVYKATGYINIANGRRNPCSLTL